MSKKYTLSETKEILRAMLGRGLMNMDYLAKELQKLALTEQDFDAGEKEDCPKELREKVMRGHGIIATLTLVNDIIAPGHDIALQLFPKEAHKFIERCKQQQDLAVKSNIKPLEDVGNIKAQAESK